MKKATKKRLSLERETIRELESAAFRRINGGLIATDTSMTTDCCSVPCTQHCDTWPEPP